MTLLIVERSVNSSSSSSSGNNNNNNNNNNGPAVNVIHSEVNKEETPLEATADPKEENEEEEEGEEEEAMKSNFTPLPPEAPHYHDQVTNNQTQSPSPYRTISIDDAIDLVGYGRFQRRMLVAAGLCSASDAMEILLLSYLSIAVQVDWDLTNTQSSTLISVVFVGAFVGTLALGRLGDQWGRKPTFVVTAGIVALFGLLSAACQSYGQLIAARFFVGLGIGGVTIPYDTYGEFLTTHTRGKGLVLPSYFWTTGTVMVALVAKWTLTPHSTSDNHYIADGSGQWRWLCIWCSIPCIVATLLSWWLVPESPRWLVSHRGNSQAAVSILRHVAMVNGKDPDELFPDGTILTTVTTHHKRDSYYNHHNSHFQQEEEQQQQQQHQELSYLPDEASPESVATGYHEEDFPPLSTKRSSLLSSKSVELPVPSSSSSMSMSSSAWELLSPVWRKTFLSLLLVWFCYAFLYYGTVLAVTAVFSSIENGTQSQDTHDDTVGVDDNVDTQTSSSDQTATIHIDFTAILVASSAEIAGATLLVCSIDRFGRRPLFALSYILGGILVLALCWVAAAIQQDEENAGVNANTDQSSSSSSSHMVLSQPRALCILLAFGARLFVFCGSSITWIWTAELLTTEHRGTGHSLANAAGRVGGFLAPYVLLSAADSTPSGRRDVGIVMLCLCLVIVATSRGLAETKGMPMGGAVLLPSRKRSIREQEHEDAPLRMMDNGHDDDDEEMAKIVEANMKMLPLKKRNSSFSKTQFQSTTNVI